MNLLKHILFLYLVIALAVTPGALLHEVEASDEPAVATCPVDFSDLFNQLQATDSNVDANQVAEAFCGHFTVDLDQSTDTNCSEMMHSAPLFLAYQSMMPETTQETNVLMLSFEHRPYSLHPEVSPHPPKH